MFNSGHYEFEGPLGSLPVLYFQLPPGSVLESFIITSNLVCLKWTNVHLSPKPPLMFFTSLGGIPLSQTLESNLSYL